MFLNLQRGIGAEVKALCFNGDERAFSGRSSRSYPNVDIRICWQRFFSFECQPAPFRGVFNQAAYPAILLDIILRCHLYAEFLTICCSGYVFQHGFWIDPLVKGDEENWVQGLRVIGREMGDKGGGRCAEIPGD